METTSTTNRRQHKRILVSSPTKVQSGDNEYSGRILNISAGGAGIQMDVQLHDNSQITVNIDDVGMIPAKVVRNLQDGVAVKFMLSEEKEQQFIRMVEGIVAKSRGSAEEKAAS
ncbi:hypothetical protein GUA87_08960 [Sneathiella sp. P13V-1]|uniref:PilZ domain-containing protein n=1 Tax=Sneathiella sp. P13V-1 TaxID=2697366 RepID=UPI00187B7F0E|nr:PilZ domain-containing protein [Sneathiella sp. P13V-1]MBE7636971.1 hypothetical protein [Sneathiella sp. P13V-1]